MAVLPIGISGEEGGYQIERSLRFNSADSAYLNRTPASAGNRKTWTWSGWVKRSSLNDGSSQNVFFGAYVDGDNRNKIGFYIDKIEIFLRTGATEPVLNTNALFRDPSAWYHVVIALDTTQATDTNRLKLYINGVQQTSFSSITYPSQNFEPIFNSATQHTIGQDDNGANYFGGYLTEVNFIDGQALDPTSFGEYNADTGVWQPIEYTGTYGTNGFYLNFSDNSGTTSTTLGKDYSGNSNNWTPNNFSVTAGAGNDSLVDVPNQYGTDAGNGGEVRGNYATLNPLQCGAVGNLSNGNLQYTTLTNNSGVTGTIDIPVGEKIYIESNLNHPINSGEIFFLGVANQTTISGYLTALRGGCISSSGSSFYGIGVENQTTVLYIYKSENGVGTTINTSYPLASSSVVGIAVDRVANDIELFIDGVSVQTLSIPSSGTLVPYVANGGGSSLTTCFQNVNFGQRPFAYAAPSGYKSLCTTNLPDPAIADGSQYMDALLYTGNGSTQSISGLSFQPDLVWIKSRSVASSNELHDVLRGAGVRLLSNSTNAEANVATVTSFNSDGFTVAIGSGGQQGTNESGTTFVGWNWKAGGSGVSNTDGSITSTVSANTTAGVSIVTYTANGVNNATVGHGLTQKPDFWIVKSRDAARDWLAYTQKIDGSMDFLRLNTTAAQQASSANAPTSSVFSIYGADINTSGEDCIAYCFHSVEGYSSFGKYTGNGSADGPFIYTGFRPRYVLVKRTDSANWWGIWDSARNTYNANPQAYLQAESSNSENNSGLSPIDMLDALSNGFKLRDSGLFINASGGTYVYACFAENPFKVSLAR